MGGLAYANWSYRTIFIYSFLLLHNYLSKYFIKSFEPYHSYNADFKFCHFKIKFNLLFERLVSNRSPWRSAFLYLNAGASETRHDEHLGQHLFTIYRTHINNDDVDINNLRISGWFLTKMFDNFEILDRKMKQVLIEYKMLQQMLKNDK